MNEVPIGSVLFTAGREGNYVSADLGMRIEHAEQIADEIAEELQGSFDTRLMVWAGPYELIMAAVDAVAASTGAVLGVCAVLDRIARRRPEVQISIELDEQTTVTLTGGGVPDEVAERVDRFFAERTELPGWGTPRPPSQGEEPRPDGGADGEDDDVGHGGTTS